MSLTQTVVSLARAKTQRDRIRVLSAAAYNKRFNSDQQAELRALLEEARKVPDENVQSLRPILNPADVCKLLNPCPLGPKPILPPAVEEEVSEWVDGWRNEALLNDRGFRPPGPLLLVGPTGVGKTMLCSYIAAELKDVRRAVVVEGHKVVTSHLGGSGERLSEAFHALNVNSGLGIIEEIDALAESRKSGAAADNENNRIAIALMRMVETSSSALIATCNRPDSLDAALLSRFEYRIDFAPPTVEMRSQVLRAALGIDGPVPEQLLRVDLRQATGLARRIQRLMVLRNLTLEFAVAKVLGAAETARAA